MAARMIRALSLSALLAALASVESRKLLARHWGHVEAFEAIRMELGNKTQNVNVTQLASPDHPLLMAAVQPKWSAALLNAANRDGGASEAPASVGLEKQESEAPAEAAKPEAKPEAPAEVTKPPEAPPPSP